jgi:C4-dicarboxylate transporter DctM subunit
MSSKDNIITSVNENIELVLSIFLLLSYSSITLYGIVSRTFGTGVSWRTTVVNGLFIWMAWLGGAYAVRHRDHLRFTLFLERMPNNIVYVIYWVEWVSWFIVAGIIFRYSIQIVNNYQEAGRTIVGTSFPLFPLYMSITVGFALILLRVVQQMYTTTRQYRAGEDISIEAGIGGE